MEPRPITFTKEGDPLQTKYYCQVDNAQHMNVVMEMLPEKSETIAKLPLRYVLLIDVSESMKNRVGSQQRTLLERVQLFAELAVRKMGEHDWMSIVTFSGDCKVEMPMTRMNFGNRQMARNILKNLTTRGNTDLECGLLGALQVIKSSPKMFRVSRDCVILFTDGEANAGELDATLLIDKYKRMQSNIGARSCVPVSAFTIGGYHPDLLIEISRRLGSESFYWLDDEEDFEADMLIPLFLRERTTISDVSIELESLDNSFFEPVDEKAAHLTEMQMNKVKWKRNKKKKKLKKPTKLFFFIHSLPDDSSKNMTFNVALPQKSPEELDGKRVVDITIHYLDAQLQPRSIQDYILISTKSLVESRSMDPIASKNIVELDANLMEVSAYVIARNQYGTSWKEAQDVVIKVAEQKCKLASVTSIANAKQRMGDDSTMVRKFFQTAYEKITKINNETQKLLPDGGENAEKIMTLCNEWKARVNYANDMLATNDERNYSKLSSMESSLYTEMPTSGGVFRGKQPYMSTNIEEKLKEERKNLEAARRLRTGSGIDVGNAERRMRKAIAEGNLTLMRECLQDLKALKLFDEGVNEDFLTYAQREIEHRVQLERVKSDLHGAIINENFSVAGNLLDEMKQLRAKTDLTFTQYDLEAFQKAANALMLHQRKRGLRAEIASNMPQLQLRIIPENMEKISKAIENLVQLRNLSKDFEDVFTDQNSTLLNLAIANVVGARKQMDSIKRRINELLPALCLSIHPQHYEEISDAIEKMQSIQIESQKFEGLFTEREESTLKSACDHRDSLSEEKARLFERIQHLMPMLGLPMLPRNYQMLSNAVDEMSSIRLRAVLFKEFFLAEYENTWTQASAKVAALLTKREDLAEKISQSILDARLPKLPANLDKLKAAVTSLNIAKEECKGFENVFTEDHARTLRKAEASVNILEAEKEETRRERQECIAQIQLPMVPASYAQISRGIDTMNRITPELKGFGLYEDNYDDLLKKADFNREVLSAQKDQMIKGLKDLKPTLRVAMIPNNLNTLRSSVEKMKTLKEESTGFEGVFTTADESDLFEASTKLAHLTASVEKMAEARHKLNEAMERRNYTRLKHAVKRASRAPFIDRDELKGPRKLLSFLNPKKRCEALKNAIKLEDIEEIEDALLQMREAHVVNDDLEEEANRALKRLRKQKRREERERRRIEKEKARRKREMERLDSCLNEAMESRDIETLEQALEEFEISEFEECELPVAKDAKELLQHLKIERMRSRLLDGIRTRKVETLYNALMDAKYGNYEEHMKKEYGEAEELLIYLLEMMRLREEIMKMTRSSISEVHGYARPPKSVSRIMKAMFTILGETSEGINTWTEIQGLMGKLDRNSITKRVQRFKIKDLSPERAEKAGKFLNNLDLNEVEDVSKVAATFFAWAKYVIKEVEHFKQRLEKKKLEAEAAENSDTEKYDLEEFEEAGNEDSQKYDKEEFESEDENSKELVEEEHPHLATNGDVKESTPDEEVPEDDGADIEQND